MGNRRPGPSQAGPGAAARPAEPPGQGQVPLQPPRAMAPLGRAGRKRWVLSERQEATREGTRHRGAAGRACPAQSSGRREGFPSACPVPEAERREQQSCGSPAGFVRKRALQRQRLPGLQSLPEVLSLKGCLIPTALPALGRDITSCTPGQPGATAAAAAEQEQQSPRASSQPGRCSPVIHRSVHPGRGAALSPSAPTQPSPGPGPAGPSPAV